MAHELSDVQCEKEIKIQHNEPVIYNWHNITNEFRNACEDLNIGELVQVDYFLLFEAMTAIELMDPKTDVGMMCNRKQILTFEESIEVGHVKIADFTMQEKIGIIDETFACLATWLEGNSLAQTVFTNLYLHNPSLINDRSMKTFCFAILKIVDFIEQLINNNVNAINEEDFQSMYGFKDHILTNSKVSAMLKDLEEETARKSKTNDDHKSAFHIRIKFTRAFYQYLLLINKQFTESIPSIPELISKIETCKSLFASWKQSIPLGIQPNLEEFNCTKPLSNHYPTIMGFSPFVNLRLLPSILPRYVKIKSRSDSIDEFERLIDRLKKIHDSTKCQTFRDLFLYCRKLSETAGLHTCICSRSILNVVNAFLPAYHVHNGNPRAVFSDDVWQFVKPFYLQSKSFFVNTQSKDYLEFFLFQCHKRLSKLLRTTYLNRARQRNRLKSVLYDLNVLVTYADRLDACFHAQIKQMDIKIVHADISYFNCYTSYYLIKSMIQYLLFGFELELYAEHELHFIYWYLQENLINWMISTLVRAHNFLKQYDHYEAILNQATATNVNSKSNKNKKLNKQTKQQGQNQHLHVIMKYNGLKFMISALYKICIVLMNKKVIKQPAIVAENLHVIYIRRLTPFINIPSPPYINFSKFNEVSKQEHELANTKTEDYVRQVCGLFEEAKTLFEYISNSDDEIELYLKVVKTNIVVLKLVLSGHKQIENLRLDFTLTPLYPTLKMI